MNVRTTALSAALLLAFGVPCAARADVPLEASLALTINALNGEHQTGSLSGADRLNFVPLPLLEMRIRRGADSLRIEGLPPVAFSYDVTTTAFGRAGRGLQTTRLGIVNATYRRALPGGWFAGAGMTLYNQHTAYPTSAGGFSYVRSVPPQAGTYPITGREEQYSRVVGARFEAGREIALSAATRLEAWAALNPALHGVQYTYVPSTLTSPTFADPEQATQVDLAARIARRIGRRTELLYGVRYLNYTAHYNEIPGLMADRNVGIAPTVGLRTAL